MRKFRGEKLWRDKIVDIIEKKGSRIHLKQLNDQEYDQKLRLKLLEEAEEVHKAQTKAELIIEIADVFEVIDALSTFHNISLSEVQNAKEKKRIACGGFFERKYVTIAEHPQGSQAEKYCLQQPSKYPEIKSDEQE